MSRGYDQLAWVDYPEMLTPISAANLNRMESGIANLYTDRNKMENNIAYVEDGDASSRHYNANAYLMHNGVFYKVTEEINIGDTLDYGLDGNITHVDISSQFGSGGGGSTGCVELTQSQYDALPEEDKMADIIYLITDAPDNRADLDEVFGDFATVEYTVTASKAYAVGDYLVYDNKFYKVSAAITQGDTITPGTNVTQTTVGDEIGNRTWRDITQTGLVLPKNQDGFREITGVSQSTKDEIKAAREVVILTTDNGRAGNYFYFVNVGNHALSINNHYGSADSNTFYESICIRVNFSTGGISGDYIVSSWGFSAPSILKIYVR